jgi:crotonobetainyl-CoA:carnitine CoA-transferase CaiB-like acyl-CoA transferase
MSLSIPLADVADAWIGDLARATESKALAQIAGATLLGERALFADLPVPGLRSAGGGCRLYPTASGWIALTLARDDDRALLPALLRTQDVADADDEALATAFARQDAQALVAQGRALGLAIAAEDEIESASPALVQLGAAPRAAPPGDMPRIVDLSALWAGPLCTHLLHLAGAQVTRIESVTRPDRMRDGRDSRLFSLLNQGKVERQLDLRSAQGRSALFDLIDAADMVVAAARPRALAQLGLDPMDFVAGKPGRLWLTVTGHGADGDRATWIGYGDDSAVAGGASAAMRGSTGEPGFIGDALGDPLSGLYAARALSAAWREGRGGAFILSMRGVVARAIAQAQARDTSDFKAQLRCWRAAAGSPFPAVPARDASTAPLLAAEPMPC